MIFHPFFRKYAESVRAKSLEEALPHALFHLASLPKGTPPLKAAEEISCGGYGALSDEFEKARKQISSGMNARDVLLGLGCRSGS